jgi:hypothetical protein
MARSRSKSEQAKEGDVEVKRKKPKKKRVDGEMPPPLQTGDISNIGRDLILAGRDVVTKKIQATQAREKKELEDKELKELKAAVSKLMASLKAGSATRPESAKSFYPKALALSEGKYLLGRRELLDRLVHSLEAEQAVFISGGTGVGKTSLLQAGLMPRLLRQGHLPVLVSFSGEPLDASIKRAILTGVDSTSYLNGSKLAKFLEHAAQVVPGNKWLVLLVDDYEDAAEFLSRNDLVDFERQWGLANANLKLRWLFSIDEGFKASLARFHPDEIVDVVPLDRAVAAQAIVDRSQGGLKLEDPYLDEILNELENHREAKNGARINPSELQVILWALAEDKDGRSPSKVYEAKGRVNGIFRSYLADVIDNRFLASDRPVLWRVLSVLQDQSARPVSAKAIKAEVERDELESERVPELLRDLRKAHVIRAKDQKYELANVNLRRGLHDRLEEEARLQTALENARTEYRRQLDNIRASALRGMLAGGVGFVMFRWLVGGLVGNPLDILFLTLLYGSIGGLTGLLLTFSTDVFIERYRGRYHWQRYLLSIATGLVMFGLALAIYVYQRESRGNELSQLILAAIVGGAWGSVAGAGIAWALGPARVQLWKIPVTAAASALTLLLFNRLLPVVIRSTPVQILLGGFALPLVLLAGVLFWKRADPD